MAEGKVTKDWYAPIVADAEAGFGGPLNAYEMMKVPCGDDSPSPFLHCCSLDAAEQSQRALPIEVCREPRC